MEEMQMKSHTHDIEGHRCRNRGQVFAIAVLVAGVASVPARGVLAEPTGVPTPTVSLPPEGQHGFPFQSEVIDFASYGYVEEEVFLEGTARSYEPVAPLDGITDGRWDATPTGPTADYKTRLLIRRPTNPSKFNGIVLVDWMNVSSGYDSDGFGGLSDELLRGYAYVGVSAQKVGVDFLVNTWETGEGARYASLAHPGDSWSYDIYSQAAQAILDPAPGDPAPLGNLTSRIKTLFTIGGSQSGFRLITYVNAVHPDADLYGGFMILLTFDSGSPLSQAPLPLVPVPSGANLRYRTDSDTPILHINTETEFVASARGLHAQPDGDRFRLWEIAGAAHATRPGIEASTAKRIKNDLPVGVPPCTLAGGPNINDMDVTHVVKAGLFALARWSRLGHAPRGAPRAELVVPADPTQPSTIVRDPTTGIAKGGIRVPDVEVPIRTLWGVRPAGDPVAGFCFLFGTVDPWNSDADPYDGGVFDLTPTPEPSLSVLYGTEFRYVAAVAASAIRNALLGYLRPYDAIEIIERARTVDIP